MVARAAAVLVYPAAAPTKQLQWTRLSDDDSTEFPDLQMATNWKDVGFILNVGAPGSASFVEIERN